MENTFEIIRNRKSCRTYQPGPISAEKKGIINAFMEQNCKGPLGDESFSFLWIERDYKTDVPMKLNYGTITGHNSYILGKAPFKSDSYVNYGFALEKILLTASELGLGTCWIGYFDPVYFPEIPKTKGEYIPSLIIVGNAAQKKKTSEKITRYFVKANARKPWKDLFFTDDFSKPLDKEKAGKFADTLEMVRLAPSSGNSQPWRIIKENESNCFHFYRKTVHALYQKRKLHDVDLGICMAHFDLAAEAAGIRGRWSKEAVPVAPGNDMEYIASWIENS